MKTLRTFASIACLAALLSSCSVGVKKDLATGLLIKYNGFSVESTSLTVGDNVLTNNEIAIGDVVTLNLIEVSGFAEKDGMVYPGCAMTVANSEGNVVMEYDDLFSAYDNTGVSPEDAKYLRVNLTVGDPMEAGESYTW